MPQLTGVMAARYKDRDEFAVALRLRTLPYAVVCALLALAAGLLLGYSIFVTLIATLLAGAAGFWLPLLLGEYSGRAGASVYMSGGSSTPAVREYSLADSLVARGQLEQAAQAYELLAGDHPDDPEPRIRLARLLRDRMARAEAAAEWFRKALAIRSIDTAREAALLREISELYTHKLRTPNKALPYLARLAAKHPHDASGQWARAEAAAIKRALRENPDG
ncbi:MAG: tetratricopeptide repeat protein [Gemmatimonadota bacterium]